MNVKKELQNDGHLKISAEFSAEEIDKAYVEGLLLFIQRAGLAFTEGGDAQECIKRAFGDQAETLMTDAVINYLIPFALTEAKDNPILPPVNESDEIPEQGKPFTLKIDIVPKAVFELSSYEPVEIVEDSGEVTEEDLDEQLQVIADSFSKPEPDILTGGTKQVAPEITDEWVANTIPDESINTVKELRENLREASLQYRAEEAENLKMEQALAAMTDRLVGEIPLDIIDHTVHEMIEDIKMQLAYQNMTFESYLTEAKTNEDYLRNDLREEARHVLARGFALDAVYRHEGLTLDEADIKAALSALSRGNEEETLRRLQDTGRMFMLEESASRMKAGKWVLSHAIVVPAKDAQAGQ